MRYIGSKSNLLSQIEDLLNVHLDGDEQTFLDIFAGTNVVGNHFKPRFTIISNDMLEFSYIDATARIKANEVPSFSRLGAHGIQQPMRFLHEGADSYIGQEEIGYYEANYTPTGEAMYLSVENGKRLDFIRETISMWYRNKWISDLENHFLVDSLISAIPSVSNTTGTYGAFLKHWDKRALKPLRLAPLQVINNGRNNECFREDANILVRKLSADILYIDPPYNNRQYASNYHLLENIATNLKPELRGKTRIFDWSPLKSLYSVKQKALGELTDLLTHARARHIILSYNSDGLIDEESLLATAKQCSIDGKVDVVRIPYRKYKSKIPSPTDELYEYLVYFRKEPKRLTAQVASPPTVAKGAPKEAQSSQYIKSPLNYIGGKYKLLPQIMPLFPKQIRTFVDLFSGGANVGINVSAEHHVFNDMNSRINEMFRLFQTIPVEQLIADIHDRVDKWQLSKTNEEAFLAFRKHYNEAPDPLDLYILSSYSYNYQFRFNSQLEFNNPFGRNRSYFSPSMERHLREFCERLWVLDTTFTDSFFEDFDYERLGSDDFVYLDPPYLITTGSYNDGSRGFRDWNANQEETLLCVLQRLSDLGVPYALSNVLEHKGRANALLAQFIKDNDVLVTDLNYNYDNSSHNSKARGSREVLVTNYSLGDRGDAMLL